MTPLQLLVLENTPIYEQLQLEEGLLRADTRNWCLINIGSPPAIVLGISGKEEQLVNFTVHNKNPIPLVRRFSGGGTVVVDQETVFITFLFNRDAVEVEPFPEKIMRWTEQLYRPVFRHPQFALRENDYVFCDRKFGGNAQYIRKERWLHHTTFLWNYAPERMRYLHLPKKAPAYRQHRDHGDFVCRLSEIMDSKTQFVERVIVELGKRFQVQPQSWETASQVLENDYRRSTRMVETTATALSAR